MKTIHGAQPHCMVPDGGRLSTMRPMWQKRRRKTSFSAVNLTNLLII